MRQIRVHGVVLAFGVLAGCGGGGAEGKLVHGMTGEPLADVGVVAAATEQVRMTCQKFKATTDAQGNWSLPDLCVSESAYTLSTDDEELWLADNAEVPQGGTTGPLEVKAWPASKSSGIYILSDGKLQALRTVADIKSETIQGTEDKVHYPSQIPPKVASAKPGDHLVVSGKEYVENLEFLPLVESGPRKFGTADTVVSMDTYWYIGTKFASDTEYEKVEAQIDDSRAILKETEEHAARFIPADALPEGRYVLKRPKDKRVYMLDIAGQGGAEVASGADEGAGEGEAEAPPPE